MNGDIRPCCVRVPIGNITQASLSEILSGEPVRRLRAELLTGNLDSVCAACRARAPIAPELLQQKIRALREEVRLPPDFDADDYLRANPDVAEVEPRRTRISSAADTSKADCCGALTESTEAIPALDGKAISL